MKSVLCLYICACLVAALQAAAVEPVSVEKQVDADAPAPTPTANDVAEECHQPKETGRCFALFHRYAYNVESRQCEEFIYGGCQGNKNNFESKADCEEKCTKAATNNAPADSPTPAAPEPEPTPTAETQQQKAAA